MRDVVIIGGGLSGLAAAYDLQQAGVAYTLIEVKPRLGGSIASREYNGFIMDSGPMCHQLADPTQFRAYLDEIGLGGAALIRQDETHYLLHRGTASLVDALAGHIKAPIMYRMAVSTLGRLDAKTFSICMENGMLLDARALIVAAPARYAERMFYTLKPEISYRLLDYRYDTITRISLGYSGLGERSLSTTLPPDYPLTSICCTKAAGRLPKNSALLQVGLRMAEHDLPDDPVGQIAALMDWPLNPATDHIATWPEANPVMWRDPEHQQTMTAIRYLLPGGVALAGGDYIATASPPRLDERVRQGREAAKRVLDWLA